LDIIWKEQGFIYKGEYRELNEHTLLLDGSLSREEAAWHPHAYCDIREAFAGRELSEGSPKNPTVMYMNGDCHPGAACFSERRKTLCRQLPFCESVKSGARLWGKTRIVPEVSF